jgi:hypothetical protein
VGDYAAVRQLTGDSANGFEAALIGDCRLFRPLAEIQPQDFLGLLQHYLPLPDIRNCKSVLEEVSRRSTVVDLKG